MSGEDVSRGELQQQHLEHAYARDLPITLTRYAAPELIGRRAIRYSEMLDYLYEQQNWIRAQQRPHQPALAPPGSVLTDEQEGARASAMTASPAGRGDYRNSHGARAAASLEDASPDTRPGRSAPGAGSAEAHNAQSLLQSVLAVAVGKAPLCHSDLHVQSYRPKDWRALEAVGVTVASLDGCASSPTAAGSRAPSTRTYAALVESEDRNCAQSLAMRYLLRGFLTGTSSASSPSASAVASSSSSLGSGAARANANGNHTEEGNDHTAAPVSIAQAAQAAGVDLAKLPTFLFHDVAIANDLIVNVDLFSGMREIPSNRPAYIATLVEWSKTLNEADAGATSLMPLMNETPAFLRHLIASATVCESGEDARKTLITAADAGTPAPAATVESYVYHPLVKPKAEQVINSLLPPRLLLFYDLDPVAAAREYERRAAHDRRIRELLLEYYRDDGDGTSGKMKQLLADVHAQHVAKLSDDALVGTAFLLVERVSPEQCPREGLMQLEEDLEMLLTESRARCWGAPIHMNPQSSNFLGTARGNEAMARTQTLREARQPKATLEARVLKPSPPPGPRNGGGGGKNGTAKPAAGATRGKPSNFFASTIHEGTVPAVQDANEGGTATVMTTLNLLELNAERTMILFQLLRGELLRQVALDSTERGVLLSRLLAEAELSLGAREEVLRASLSHSQESLDKGNSDRAGVSEEELVLEKEVLALKAKLNAAQARKLSIEAWVEERKAAEKNKAAQDKNFQDLLLERLQRHTKEVRDAQDRDRRGSVDSTA